MRIALTKNTIIFGRTLYRGHTGAVTGETSLGIYIIFDGAGDEVCFSRDYLYFFDDEKGYNQKGAVKWKNAF